MKKLQKLKNAKFRVAPKYKGVISEQEVKEGFNEILEKIMKEKGERWFELHNDQEIKEIIMANAEQVGKEYFERKAREKFVNKLTEDLMKLKDE